MYDSLIIKERESIYQNSITKLLSWYNTFIGKQLNTTDWIAVLEQDLAQQSGSDCGAFVCLLCYFLSNNLSPLDIDTEDIAPFRYYIQYVLWPVKNENEKEGNAGHESNDDKPASSNDVANEEPIS